MSDPVNSGVIILKPTFRTILLPKKSRVKTGVLCKTQLPLQSLQNNPFVQDLLQKLSVKSHQSNPSTIPAAKQFRKAQPQPLTTTAADTPTPMVQPRSPPPNVTTSRFPVHATKIQLPHLQHDAAKKCCCIKSLSSATHHTHHALGMNEFRHFLSALDSHPPKPQF